MNTITEIERSEIILQDFAKHNVCLVQKTLEQLTAVFGQSILADLFIKLLLQNWWEYTRLN